MPASARPVLVTGATGYIGGRLVPRLLEAGHRVRCLAREPRKLDDRPWSGAPRVEVVAGASVGVALTAALDDRPADLLRRADHAMFEAKKGGRGQWRAAARPELEADPGLGVTESREPDTPA